MKKRKVIKSINRRFPNPITTGIVYYLFLKQTEAADWLYGAVGSVFVTLLIIHIVDLFNTEDVDIFKDK